MARGKAVVKSHPEWKIAYDYLKKKDGQEELRKFVGFLRQQRIYNIGRFPSERDGDFHYTWSPCHYAVYHGDIKFVEFLLTTFLGEGFNPFKVRVNLGLHEDVVDLDDTDYSENSTIFHLAFYKCRTEIIKLLVKHSDKKEIDIKQRDDFNLSPIDFLQDNVELAEFLLDNCYTAEELRYKINRSTFEAIAYKKYWESETGEPVAKRKKMCQYFCPLCERTLGSMVYMVCSFLITII